MSDQIRLRKQFNSSDDAELMSLSTPPIEQGCSSSGGEEEGGGGGGGLFTDPHKDDLPPSTRLQILGPAGVVITDKNTTTVVLPQKEESSNLLNSVILCILVTETAERVCYFGFRAVLVLYFIHELEFDEPTAVALFAWVTCLAYASPPFGALLADGSLGRYRTILYFGVLYSLGMIVLSVGALDASFTITVRRTLTFIGLVLVCIGTGGIKPCVSAFGADQVIEITTTLPQPSSHEEEADTGDHQANKDRVRQFFAYFYFCINVGAVASMLIIPVIKAKYGFGMAFLTPTIFLLFAMVLFPSKRKDYKHHIPGEGSSSLSHTFRLCGLLLLERFRATFPRLSCLVGRSHHTLLKPSSSDVTFANSSNNEDFDDDDDDDHPERNQSVSQQQLRDAEQALHVIPIMLMLPMFWMLYDQQGSVWTLQASRMDLHGLQPEQMNLVNPILIMMFIPLFDRSIYPTLEGRGWNIAPLRRMGLGMVFCAIGFFTSAHLENMIRTHEEQGLEKIHVFWQLPQITIVTVAEILLSVTGLEFAYATSPERMKAFLLSVYLLTVAIGDFFGGVLYSSVFRSLDRATVMNICAIIMLGNFCLFCCMAKWWERCEAEKNLEKVQLNRAMQKGTEVAKLTGRTTEVEMTSQHLSLS